MAPHDQEQLHARQFAVECYYTSGKVLAEAIQQFEGAWNAKHDNKIADVRSFIRHNVQKFEGHSTLHDLGGQGRHVTVPDDVVRQIGSIISKGHTQQCTFSYNGKEIKYQEGSRFASLSEAIRESAEIQELLQRYRRGSDEEGHVKYMLRRLHEVVPTLVYAHLPMKRALSAEDKLARVKYCQDMLVGLEEDPNMLDGVYWGDECSIWLNKHECGQLMVWFERRDVHGLPPAENVFCGREGSVRLELFLVVNARRGLVWVEFLTGTDGLETDGRHNQLMRDNMRIRQQLGLGCYKVGAG